MNQLLLSNKVAVITGGNSGIGKAIATIFAQQGAHIVILGTNAEKCLEVVTEIQALIESTQKIIYYCIDVSQAMLVKECFVSITTELGEIDILVNCAGVTRDALFIKMSEQEWDQVIDINLKSVYNTTQAVFRNMLKRRQGVLINITSVVGLIGNIGQANYAASKAGVIGFSKTIAREGATRKVRVNCIAPGFIKTKMTEKLSEQQKLEVQKQIPLGQFGTVADVADVALFN